MPGWWNGRHTRLKILWGNPVPVQVRYPVPFVRGLICKGVFRVLLKECRMCGNLIPYGATYCTVCTPKVEAYRAAQQGVSKRAANRRYNRGRDPKYIHFYNSGAWRTLSAKYTQDRGYKCESCGKIATEVHHKIPIQTEQGWTLRLDYNNLELLCVDCHNERHKRFKKRKERRKDYLESKKSSLSENSRESPKP